MKKQLFLSLFLFVITSLLWAQPDKGFALFLLFV